MADNEVDEGSSHATVDPWDQPSPSLPPFVERVAKADLKAVTNVAPASDHPTPSSLDRFLLVGPGSCFLCTPGHGNRKGDWRGGGRSG